MDVRSELREAGVAGAEAEALAAIAASPPSGMLDPGEQPADDATRRLLQVVLACARELRRHGDALRAVLDAIEPKLSTLSAYDAGRYWHLRGLFAWRVDESTFAATRALNASLRVLEADKSALAPAYAARVHDTFGQLLHQGGMLADARRELERALLLRGESGNLFGRAITLGNLGRLCVDLGDFAGAAQYLREDLSLVEKHSPEATALRAQLLSHLGDCSLHLGEVDRAAEQFAASLALAGEPVSTCFAKLGLGRVALRRGDSQRALAAVDEVRTQVSSAEVSAHARTSLLAAAEKLAGDAHASSHAYQRADAAYRAALAHLEQSAGASPLEYAEVFRGLADALDAEHHPTESARNLRLALWYLDGTAAEAFRREVERQLEHASRDSWLLHAAGRFVGQRHIERLLEGTGMAFDGQQQHVVVLFSDIRGFTTLSERLSPRRVVEFLNDFFTHMTRCIEQHDGMVDKFIGDAVMAVFPIDADGGSRAIDGALAMREELERLNRHLGGDVPPLSIGLGLHAGEVIAGLIGSPQKREYTVIGDVVNAASRLESMTKQLGATTLVSAAVVTPRDRDRFLLRPLGAYAPKGKKRGLEVFDVMGVRDRSPASVHMAGEIASVEAALAAFRARSFDDAARAFAQLAQRTTGTERAVGYELLAASAHGFAEEPPPDGWGGEVALTNK